MLVRNYKGEPRYILETNYGCHSTYGWTVAAASDEWDCAEQQYKRYQKLPGSYRIIDNKTSRIIMY